MKKEAVWKVGPTARMIYSKLSQILRYVESSSNIYLSDNFLHQAGIHKQNWDLADTDERFACMTMAEFAKLRPSEPSRPFILYEDVEFPDSDPPHNVFDLEDCAYRIEIFFKELQVAKISMDGRGFAWPNDSSLWVPREKYRYEDLSEESRMPPSVSWYLHRAYYNDDKPHQLYHACHGDEGSDGDIARSELEILVRCMKGRMADRTLCMHNIPVRLLPVASIFVLQQLTLCKVLLLSIHGAKARIMIAHFNLNTNTLDVKCSKFEQFDGFEAKKGTGSEDGRVRPHDFEAKRDLFFRWLNPICQGDTYLEDTKDGQELVLRGPKGRKRLVPRTLPRQSSSTESSETYEET